MLSVIKSYVANSQISNFIVIIMAIALQIQVTLFAEGNYLGLRISLADILLPFWGVFVIYSLITKRSYWPKWSMRLTIFWLVMLVMVMSFALLNGYIVNGFLASWAFINKYIGFLILISYLMLGGWVLTNARNINHVLSLFMAVFAGFFILTILASMILFFLQYITAFPLLLSDYPWDGFMANRNAFMVIFVLSFVLIIYGHADKNTMLPVWINKIFWLCFPSFVVFNDSRTGWIVAFILLVIFFVKEPFRRAMISVPFLLIGTAIICCSYYVTTDKTSYILKGRQAQHLISIADGQTDYIGDQKRYIAVEDGLDLYRKYNPLVGAGLGTYKFFQIEKRGEFIEVMDFTGLWLLVETGAVGLFLFSAFFLSCTWHLYCRSRIIEASIYYRAMFVFLIMFAGMSMLHEIMYTRALWFAIGLALAGRAGGRSY